MKVTVRITKTLDDIWATEDDLREMGDAEVIELIQEDVLSFLENAEWTVERMEGEKP